MVGYYGKDESVFHLMFKSMVGRVDLLPEALLSNSYGIVNLRKDEFVCARSTRNKVNAGKRKEQ